MEVLVPWQLLIALIERHYLKTSKKGGRPPYPLATMLRIHLQQQWYFLSDPAMEEALIEVPTMRRFVGIDQISGRIPDETTILSYRHLMEKQGLVEQILRPSKLTSALVVLRPSPPRTRLASAIQRCTRLRRAINGISG
jgi:IS5 family transposase